MKINPMHSNPKYKFQLTPRCGAKTRNKTPCLAPAIRGAKRCRMHGGKGSGAPKNNANALRHGFYTRKFIKRRRQTKELMKDCITFVIECSEQINEEE